MFKRVCRAQSLGEYAIGIAVIVVAFMGMSVYVKRGLQGRYADVVQATVKSVKGNHYEPYYLESKADIELGSKNKVLYEKGQKMDKDLGELTYINVTQTNYLLDPGSTVQRRE